MVTSRLLFVLAASVPFASPVQALEMSSRAYSAPAPAIASFRAPFIPATDLVSLPPLDAAKSLASGVDERGRIRVALARDLDTPAMLPQWSAVPGGYVARFRVASQDAPGLRVKLELGTVPGSFEVRAQGSADHRIETMDIDPVNGNVAWTPWTEGAAQLVEVFSPVRPSRDALRVGSVLHFTESLVGAKLAAACTVSTMCSAESADLDTAIAERKKSVFKMSFVDGGRGFICTGTLINTEKFPAAYLLTANHCIDNAAAAATLTTLWFYESADCAVSGGIAEGRIQVSGGAQLVFGNHNVDSTLLLMNRTPPSGAVYAGWSDSPVPLGIAFVSISHPDGDTARFALGTTTREYGVDGYPQAELGVRFTRGIIEGGSSGSGLFMLANGALQLRGILTGTTVRAGGLSCDNQAIEEGLYGRFEIFGPQIQPYIRAAGVAADDAPNRFQDLGPIDLNGADKALNLRGAPLVLTNRRIDYAGDLDVYRFTLTQETSVTIASEGAMDVVGSLLDPRGVELEHNDDVDPGVQQNFSITKTLQPGTYYVQVGAFAADGTGTYGLRFTAAGSTSSGFDFSSANYTDLWWNANESGWGLNVNHQGDIIFATLFTYDSAGPMWLVLANGAKQADGSYQGSLFRTTGPVFNASPWTSSTATEVGTMRLAFSGASSATLTYTVNGTSVTKSITRQGFSTPTTCTWTTGDRATATNFQDLWWNPAESGWGVNVTQQGNVVFATLFTYDATGRGLWLVLPNATRTGLNSNTFSGPLYRTTGPVFNAAPWTTAVATQVGTMTFAFTSGNSGTLTYSVDGVNVTKSIQRQAFSSPLPQCTTG